MDAVLKLLSIMLYTVKYFFAKTFKENLNLCTYKYINIHDVRNYKKKLTDIVFFIIIDQLD